MNHLPGEAAKKQSDPPNLHVQAKACVLDLERFGKHEKFNCGIGLSLQKTPDYIVNSFKGHLNLSMSLATGISLMINCGEGDYDGEIWCLLSSFRRKKKHVLGFIVWSDDLVGLFK